MSGLRRAADGRLLSSILRAMRIAVLGCSDADTDRIRSIVGEAHAVTPADAIDARFDAAVIGTDADRDAALDLASRAAVPAIVLLRKRDEDRTIGDRVTALAVDDIAAVGHVLDREVRLQSGARALAERAWRDRELVRRIPGSVWTWSRTSGFMVLSDYIEEITGFSAAEFRAGGMEFWAGRIHPADVKPVFEGWDELFERRHTSYEVEYRFLRKDATWAWLHERISLMSAGSDQYVIGATSEITARRIAEESLRRSELRYRTLVEQARDVIFSIDSDGCIASLNEAFETLTGWPRAEWIGRPLLEVLERRSAVAARRDWHSAPAYREYRMRTKWGHSIAIEAVAQTIESDGQHLGAVGIARDITTRKQAEAQVAQEKRLSSIGRLATSVAHDFNNVLMSIMPFAEVIARRFPEDERVVKATRHIMDAVRRGRDISQEVLRVARPAKPVMAPLRVEEWLDEFAVRATAMLGSRHRFERAHIGRDLVILADRALLDQIASNIVANAADAMDKAGTLTVSARRAGAMIEIEFGDTGRGIDDTSLDHVFEPLFTTKHGRSGLGLSLAHQAMKQQEGAIRVRSKVGEGSTFTLSFKPVADARANRRMLIVEDDETVGEGLATILMDEGLDVRLVPTGRDAVPSVAEFRPDFVLLDLNLPDMSGVDVYDHISEQWPKLPIVFSTGHADRDALASLHARQAPSITKPYDIKELMAMIARL